MFPGITTPLNCQGWATESKTKTGTIVTGLLKNIRSLHYHSGTSNVCSGHNYFCILYVWDSTFSSNIIMFLLQVTTTVTVLETERGKERQISYWSVSIQLAGCMWGSPPVCHSPDYSRPDSEGHRQTYEGWVNMCVQVCVGNVGSLWQKPMRPISNINTNVQPKLPWQLQTKVEASSITLRAGRAPPTLSDYLSLLLLFWDFTQYHISGHLLQSRFLCFQAVWLISRPTMCCPFSPHKQFPFSRTGLAAFICHNHI